MTVLNERGVHEEGRPAVAHPWWPRSLNTIAPLTESAAGVGYSAVTGSAASVSEGRRRSSTSGVWACQDPAVRPVRHARSVNGEEQPS